MELCQEEREEIFAGLAAGRTCRAIGARMGRDASVISREVARNGGRDAYRPSRSQATRTAALEQARRDHPERFRTSGPVLPKTLRLPEQVWINKPEDPEPQTITKPTAA
ncbi:helix-turn-helix domain-containing protein [Kineosporia corallincola]|uniref:helix-turn-helix domain-containing protein n=1 Tax=Kineosporia corallincola TaxID=2835133 RepID=UPI003557985C